MMSSKLTFTICSFFCCNILLLIIYKKLDNVAHDLKKYYDIIMLTNINFWIDEAGIPFLPFVDFQQVHCSFEDAPQAEVCLVSHKLGPTLFDLNRACYAAIQKKEGNPSTAS